MMKTPIEFQFTGENYLSQSITALIWSPRGDSVAISSVSGEVGLLNLQTLELISLRGADHDSVDYLEFSADGKFLAAAGSTGQLKIWEFSSSSPQCLATLDYTATGINGLVWNPVNHQLAFGLGQYVQVWDIQRQEIITTLNFELSSVLDLDWRNDGLWLAVSGYKTTQVWNTQNWDDDPELIAVPSGSIAIAWSPDCRYLACGNLNRTVLLTEWGNPDPWLMQGFTANVQQVAWSSSLNAAGTPLLAASSGKDIVVWERTQNEPLGWTSEAVSHEGEVQAIAFHPKSLSLASAGKEGWLHLWHRGQQLLQSFNSRRKGFSCLSWHPNGHQLVAGGEEGEICLWSQTGYR